MAIGSVLKRVVTGIPGAAASIGKSLANEVAPGTFQGPAQSAQVLAPQPQEAEPEIPGFELPELDPNDPDYEEKQANHKALERLSELFQESMKHDNIDYRKKYKEMADYVASKPEPRRWSPLSSFAIAMGNPGALNAVAATNKDADEERRQREEKILDLQEEAIKGEISQAMTNQNFRKALTQSKILTDLEITRGRIKAEREHKQELEKIKAQNEGKENVAKIKAASAEKTVNDRLRQIVERYKLSASNAKALYSLASHYISGLQAQKDAAGEPIYNKDDIEGILHQAVSFAEDHMDERDEKVPAAVETAPAGSNAPVKAPAGPKPNDAVAERFAKRRAERAAAQTK